MPQDLFDSRVFHFATELERLGGLHAELGTPWGLRTARAAFGGGAALLHLVVEQLDGRPVTAAQFGATAQRLYGRAGLELEGARLATLLERRGLARRPLEVFPRCA